MAADAVARALGKVPLFAPLSQTELQLLAQQVKLREYELGTAIVTQGSPGGEMYIVLDGHVQIVHRRQSGKSTEFGKLGRGAFFGEMALLEDRPRSADVVATARTMCAVLGRDEFQRLLQSNPLVASRLLSSLSHRVRDLTELVEQPRVETSATPEQRERRILLEGEGAMAADIRGALVIKSGNHFTLLDPRGSIPLGNNAGFGLYLGDTRHLSAYELTLGRVEAVALMSTAHLGHAADQQLTNRDIRQGRRTIRKETLLIGRQWRADEVGFEEDISISNFNAFAIDLNVQLRFAADFADIFEVRGIGRPMRGVHHPGRVTDDEAVLAYRGLDERQYLTHLHFDPAPSRLAPGRATYQLRIPPAGKSRLRVRVAAEVVSGSPPSRHHVRTTVPPETLPRATSVNTDNPLFDAAISRSLADLALLRSQVDGQSYVVAGIPWYAALFGRDSLLAALQMLAWTPDLAAATLRLLARYQGTRTDRWRDEEPGKILHELRTGELARLQQIPHTPYYGSVDSTPLFIILAAEYYDWTGDLDLLRDIHPQLEAALEWCTGPGDADGDGYLEYKRRSPKGLANQGWRDCGDGVLFQDGRLPRPPIALVEVQAYLYKAYRCAARLLTALSAENSARATALGERAAQLRCAFNSDFWMAAQDFYALGLDAGKQHIDAITSNPGQALWTGIIDQKRQTAVVDRLLSEDLFSGWGIRTLSDRSPAYNPLGYHLGTVWPHDNSIIVAGLKGSGFDAAAARVFDAIWGAATHFAYLRLPELFSGLPRTSYAIPVGYPVACSPQAWAAGTLPFMLTQLLGLQPRDGRILEIVRPRLPAGITTLHVRGMRVGSALLDLTFEREPGADAEATRVSVDRQVGALEIRSVG
jgi:glycogen debranching enzyme/CRP-like cAMP-binding protein